MTHKISTATAEHYHWGDSANPCDGWHLLRSEELSVIEELMPPDTAEQRHFHRRSRQLFYVLAGELTIELDGVEHLLLTGEALEILPGKAHQAINRSKADTRFLVASQPPSHGDRYPVQAGMAVSNFSRRSPA